MDTCEAHSQSNELCHMVCTLQSPEWHGLLNPTSEAINGKLPMGPIPQDEGTALYNEIHEDND